jgi:transposase
VPRDGRDDRIAELERHVAERDEVIAKLTAQVEALLGRIAKLEEQARRSSRNSSQPPSSDGPGARPARTKVPSGRKPGAQEGHDKHDRPLVPPDKINKRVVLRPTRCRGCRAALFGEDPSPRRHQVFELPRICCRASCVSRSSPD